METPTLNVLQVTEAAYLGDHAADITKAIEVNPNTPVVELVSATLFTKNYKGEVDRPQYDRYLVIRIAEPIATHAADPEIEVGGPF